MNLSLPRRRPADARSWDWLRSVAALLIAVAGCLVLARVLVTPHASDMRTLALYLAVSSAATIAGGWLVMRAVDGAAHLSLRAKSVFAALTGTAVSLLNVLIVAKLMFVSTAHDLRLLLVLTVFGASVTVVFSLWVGSRTVAGVQSVADAVRVLAAGRYTERVTVTGGDEVASLARDLNALADRLRNVESERAAVDAERRELTAAVSHDLRTPLSSMRAMVEALDDGIVEEPGEVRHYHATMRREIDRLGRMIDDLFELAQLDAGAYRLNLAPVSLVEVVTEVADAMQANARQHGLALDVTVPAGRTALAHADGGRIERAIANVVRNAIEHTPSGGRICVSLSATTEEAEVSVRDTGEGIAAADLQHIWTRFYRASKSRTRSPRSENGAGLGLAITRGIIESHGGTVAASSAPGNTTIVLRLPLAPS